MGGYTAGIFLAKQGLLKQLFKCEPIDVTKKNSQCSEGNKARNRGTNLVKIRGQVLCTGLIILSNYSCLTAWCRLEEGICMDCLMRRQM